MEAPLGPIILLHTLFSETLRILLSFNVRKQISLSLSLSFFHTHTHTQHELVNWPYFRNCRWLKYF